MYTFAQFLLKPFLLAGERLAKKCSKSLALHICALRHSFGQNINLFCQVECIKVNKRCKHWGTLFFFFGKCFPPNSLVMCFFAHWHVQVRLQSKKIKPNTCNSGILFCPVCLRKILVCPYWPRVMLVSVYLSQHRTQGKHGCPFFCVYATSTKHTILFVTCIWELHRKKRTRHCNVPSMCFTTTLNSDLE